MRHVQVATFLLICLAASSVLSAADDVKIVPDVPLLEVTTDDASTLLIAGDADDLVPVKHSRDIQAAFQDKGVTSQLIEIAGAGHGFRGEQATRATKELVAWFEKHLTITATAGSGVPKQ